LVRCYPSPKAIPAFGEGVIIDEKRSIQKNTASIKSNRYTSAFIDKEQHPSI
jgi:hypothetical protein